MTKFQGAVVSERSVIFAIVAVNWQILMSQSQAGNSIKALRSYFPGIPIILTAQDSKGIPKYWGRKDIIDFLVKIQPGTIPWKEYSFAGGK